MSKKIIQAPVTPITIVCDEVLVRKDGVSLRIRVDLATILTDINKRHQALLIARHIPLDRDNLSPSDAVVAAYRKQLPPEIDNDTVIEMARKHYQQFSDAAYNDAAILAMFNHKDNSHLPNPTPYDAEEIDEADDLVQVSEPGRNLLHPTERKLKQIMDFLQSDVALYARFQSIFNNITIQVNRMANSGGVAPATNEAGFQSGRTGGDILTLNVAPGVQPEVET